MSNAATFMKETESLHNSSSLNMFLLFYRMPIRLVSLSILTIVGVILSYYGNLMGILPNAILDDTPLYMAFSAPEYIYVGLIINFSTSIPTAFDLFVDLFDRPLNNDCDEIEHESWTERLYLVIINIFCSVFVLLNRSNANIPYIYACTHALQYVFTMGVILMLCNKLAPAHFNEKYIVLTHLFFGLGGITSMMGFGHGILYWPNLVTFALVAAFFYCLFGKILFPWLKSLRTRMIYGKETISVKEQCCIWYLGSAVLVILFVPCIIAAIKYFDWSNFDIYDVYVFIFSYAVFNVVTSSVPSRLAKAAVVNERRKVTEMKRSLIRYISHEVRSPLNVIYSGIKFILEDLSTVANSREKDMVLDTLGSIQQACTDVLYTMNDILQLENMSSGTFSLSRSMVHCSELNEMMDHCDIAAREKGVNFCVNNEFLPQNQLVSVNGGFTSHVMNEELQDIESGGGSSSGGGGSASEIVEIERSNPNPMPSPMVDTFIYVDGHKIGQVLRNLITNAVKFTPPNESITVNIRPATDADMADLTYLKLLNAAMQQSKRTGRRQRSFFSAKDKYMAISDEALELGFEPAGKVIIEVIDTGAGIAKDSKARLFGEFAHIASTGSDNLEGGEGSGLGLWVSQEIVRHHGSLIHYYSEGIGQGTRFYFMLHGYAQSNAAMMEDMEDRDDCPEHPAAVLPMMSSKIYPESQNIFSKESSDHVPEVVVPKDPLARIRERSLCNAGVFKVLVVDDSALNVKVMVRLLKSTIAKHPTVFASSNSNSNSNSINNPARLCSEVVDIDHDLDGGVEEKPVVMEIVEADDGQTAVAKVAEAAAAGAPFDAVFMDNIMNHMNGPDAAQMMRAAGFEGLIIGVTGNVMVTDVDGYIAAGANLVLFKPINPPEILPVLKKMKQQ